MHHILHHNFEYTDSVGTIVGATAGIITSVCKHYLLFAFIMPSVDDFITQGMFEIAAALPAGIVGAIGGFLGTKAIKYLWNKIAD